jgi:hypothetical protein
MLPEPQHNQSGQCYCGCFLADILLCLSLLPPAGSLLGEQSLLMLPEPQHKYLRNLIMPAFTNEAIERLVPRMEAVLARYLDTWASAGAPVKAHNELRHMTFEFIVAVGAAAHAWLPSASVVFSCLCGYLTPMLLYDAVSCCLAALAYPPASRVSYRMALDLNGQLFYPSAGCDGPRLSRGHHQPPERPVHHLGRRPAGIQRLPALVLKGCLCLIFAGFPVFQVQVLIEVVKRQISAL